MERPDFPTDDSAWALLMGPGEDLDRLAPLLDGLLEAGNAGPDLTGVYWLDDLAELLGEIPDRGRLVLHAAWLPLEDLGLVRRFLDARPGWELVLVGRDPGASAPRRLGRSRVVRWFHEPLDLDHLDELLAPPAGVASPAADDFEGSEDDIDPLSAALDVTLEKDELEAFRAEPGDAAWFDDEAETADEDPLDDDGLDDLEGLEALEDRAEGEELARALEQARREFPTAPRELGDDFASDADGDDPVADEIERILAEPPGSSAAGQAERSGPAATVRRATPVVEQDDAARPTTSPAARPDTRDPFGALLRDIEEYEAPTTPEAVPALPDDLDVATDDDSAEEAAAPAPAPYFKQQVADLADIALRIELSLEMARERAMEEGDLPALDDLELEIRRLSQYTRTLGYLASPPAAGRVQVGLAKMVEEMLAEAGNDDHSPRYLWRTDGPLDVRCDKTLMHHALEAVLYLVHHCAGADGTVRVEGKEHAGPDGPDGSIELTLRFPAGPLAHLAPERAVVPYALRALLPELGPNALAAAAGILRGQGGELRLLDAGGEWLWRLRLPRA